MSGQKRSEFVSFDATLRLLSLSEEGLERAVREGKLRSFRGGGQMKFLQSDIDAYLAGEQPAGMPIASIEDSEEEAPPAFSLEAKAIYDKLKPLIPEKSWDKPVWTEEGVVEGHDLRTKAGREGFEEDHKRRLAYLVMLDAKNNEDSVDSYPIFSGNNYEKMARIQIKILLIVAELDYQVETTDACTT